jgi:hypothetical protein
MKHKSEAAILQYAAERLYGQKSLTQKNVECFISGFKCAMHEVQEPLADVLQKRGDYWVNKLRAQKEQDCGYADLRGRDYQRVMDEVSRYEEIGQMCLTLAEKLRQLEKTEME